MRRLFYGCNSLEAAQNAVDHLHSAGLTDPQIHILSEKDAELARRRLNDVHSILRRDIIRSTQHGALLGAAVAGLTLFIGYMMGLTSTAAGWAPLLFLSVVLFGFCTWEAGLFGIHQQHHQFKRFSKQLESGQHILIVDIDKGQERDAVACLRGVEEIKALGGGKAAPAWFVHARNRWDRFVEVMP